MKKSLILILFISLFFSINTFAQIKQFRDSLFIEDLETFMKTSIKNNEEIEETFEQFKENWEQGKIDEGSKFGIILTSNLLHSRRGRANTHFFYYLKTINSFISKNKMKQYMEWEMGFMQLLDIQEEYIYKISDFLKFSALLIGENILIQTPSFTWQAKQDNFIIKNDPEKEELIVEFKKIDLICYNSKDTITIEQTEGILYPTDKKWEGKNGKITWERVGLDGNSVFVQIHEYEIDMNSSRYEIKDVTFTNKKYNQIRIIGHFEEKLMNTSDTNKISYPRFYSKDKNIFIKNILPNIDFKGACNMIGKKFIGFGTNSDPAQLFINRKKQLFIRTESKQYTFTDTEIESYSTFASIKLSDKDSIYHSNIHFNFKQKITQKDSIIYPYFWNNFAKKGDDMQLLSLSRSGKGTAGQAFIDTYHKFNIFAGEILWKQGDSLLYVKTTPRQPEQKKAIFKSYDYFTIKDYNPFQDGTINHISAIKLFSETIPYDLPDSTKSFTAQQYTDFINKKYSRRLTVRQINPFLIKLYNQDLIFYNSTTQQGRINEKLNHWVGNRTKTLSKGKNGIDYDNITIISSLKNIFGINAIINLKENSNNNYDENFEMIINSPQPVPISNNRRVSFYTDRIVVNKNREMTFNGAVRAGLLDYYGNDFNFDYEKFNFNMPQIDSITLIVIDTNKLGEKILVKVESTIEVTNGQLKIDSLNNKSGTIPLYSNFLSEDTSMIYYNRFDTTYHKNKFYVKTHRIEMDSLNFISKKDVEFEGTFHSSVFDDLEVKVTLQEDKSLGFNMHTDSIGDGGPLKTYGGEYTGTIILDTKGLHGKGEIKYLTSVFKSDNFKFMPDSITGIIKTMEMKPLIKEDINTVPKAKGEFPQISINNAYFNWTKNNTITCTSLDENFKLYNNIFNENSDTTTGLSGKIEITDKGVKGIGTLDFIDAKLVSNNFNFQTTTFNADTTNFVLKDKNLNNKNSFKTDNVQASVDIIHKQGVFISNSDTNKIVFPANKYVCIMDHFIWNIGNGILDIGGGIPNHDNQTVFANTTEGRDSLRLIHGKNNVRLQGTQLISYKPDQDTLHFQSSSTVYDVNNKLITAKGVSIIEVADAKITPNGFVYVEKDAKMRTLHDATISTTHFVQKNDTTLKINHVFKKAEIDIAGAKYYSGSGEITYKYQGQKIQFQNIMVEDIGNKLVTVANTEKDFNDTLYLNPYFIYIGRMQDDDISFRANEQFLTFNGYTNIIHECNQIQPEKFRFDAKINPDSVFIPIGESIINKDGRRLFAGMYMEFRKPNSVYPAFISPRRNTEEDKTILTSKGFMYFDKKTGYYKIANKLKINNPDTLGTIVKYHSKFCILYGEGNMNFNMDFNDIKYESKGIFIESMNQNKSTFRVMLSFDFFFSEPRLNDIADAINLMQLDPVDMSTKQYKICQKQWLGEEEAQQIRQEIDEQGYYSKLPKAYIHNFMFSEVTFRWDSINNAFTSVGKLGISNIGTNEIDKYVEGHIQMKKRGQAGDELFIYLEPYPGTWYFFRALGNVMNCVSSDEEFNKSIIYMKDKNKKQGRKYKFTIGEKSMKDEFLKSLK